MACIENCFNTFEELKEKAMPVLSKYEAEGKIGSIEVIDSYSFSFNIIDKDNNPDNLYYKTTFDKRYFYFGHDSVYNDIKILSTAIDIMKEIGLDRIAIYEDEELGRTYE